MIFIFLYISWKEPFYDLLSKFTLPYDNPDFQFLIEKTMDIELLKVIISVLFIAYMPYLLLKNTSNTFLRSEK